jgi:hypothetical protein
MVISFVYYNSLNCGAKLLFFLHIHKHFIIFYGTKVREKQNITIDFLNVTIFDILKKVRLKYHLRTSNNFQILSEGRVKPARDVRNANEIIR